MTEAGVQTPRVGREELETCVVSILQGLSVPAPSASVVAEALVESNLVGHDSHGVRQLSAYADMVRSGELQPDASPAVTTDTGGLVVVDGRRAFGPLVGDLVARLAVDRARSMGIACVATRDAGHLGRIGRYAEAVAAEGLVAFSLVTFQGADQQIAPFGGLDRRLTNNPVAFAAPGYDYPLSLDMALSTVAEGKVLLADERAEQLPDGWIQDASGRPSQRVEDYLSGGSLQLLGGATSGHKGYALIMLVELLVGLLAGGGMCRPGSIPFANAMIVIAIDPSPVTPSNWREQMDEFIEYVKSSAPRDGNGAIRIPGELEHLTKAERLANGIPLDEATAVMLRGLGEQLGVTVTI
jgi:hydroxycarboxylate dehydrogenase B